MTSAPIPETYAFQAEINQLLSLIINTFYTNKDVFLRELISNASDACDKLRFKKLTSGSVVGEDELRIRIATDKEAKTVTIEDSGIGMTKEDLVSCLGTIAKSGTKAFMEALKEGQADVSMIGQFGVGFYSAYLVADSVHVTTKHDDDGQYIWESSAGGSFTITPSDDSSLQRGTRIVLHLKEDQGDYLSEDKLRSLIKRHSEFVAHPIELLVEKQVQVEETKDDEGVDKDEKEEGDVEDVEDVEDDSDETKKDDKAPKYETRKEYDRVNTQRPIWTRKPEDVTHDEYASFYKSIANDWEDHMAVKHFSAEGQVEFKALLYLPRRMPFEIFNANYKQNNIKLYVRRVFIMDNSEDLIPPYFSFVKGIVDSNDLPLNVSREILQQNNIVKVIKRNLVKKVIEMMSELAEKKDDYKHFYEQFGRQLKFGIHEDSKNRDKLAKLLRFSTSKSGDEMISLDDYVTRMKEGQKSIYYITGESKKAVETSPFIEKLKKRGYEVLFMVDAIDEYMMQTLREFDGKQFTCVTKDTVLFEESEDEKKAREEKAKELEPLCKAIKDVLGDGTVTAVKVSDRVADSPCVLVTDMFGWTANMERIMKAQALRDTTGGPFNTGARKTLEINPDNLIIKDLLRQVREDVTKINKDLVRLLYDTALISSGFTLDDPSKFTDRIHRMIVLGLGIDTDNSGSVEVPVGGDASASVAPAHESSMEDVD